MRNKSHKQIADSDAALESIMQPNCCYHCQDIATIFESCRANSLANPLANNDTFLRDHYDD
ncbi:hypothetical protein NBRC116592_10180 [Colwellia sp. KU-HH00111]|uniref:hypothetical protein n=1 Tax=Colwellia sp. KU-HH00111 TaxID=3127652 RepID=UPI00310C0175